MGLFNGRKFNSTFFDLRGDNRIPQEIVYGLITKTIEVLNAHNCVVDIESEKKKGGWLEYKLMGGGNVTFIMQIPSRLDITVSSPLTKKEFEDVEYEIEQYPISLGLVPKQDYFGFIHHYGNV